MNAWLAVILLTTGTCYHVGWFQFQNICEEAIVTIMKQRDEDADFWPLKSRCVSRSEVQQNDLPRPLAMMQKCIVPMED